MKIEDSDPELKDLAKKVFTIAEWLSGRAPEYQAGSGWYKCGKPIFAWFYLTGRRAKKHPANSILVAASQSDEKLAESAQRIGNNVFGKAAHEFIVTSGDNNNFVDYLEFVARAYKARCNAK